MIKENITEKSIKKKQTNEGQILKKELKKKIEQNLTATYSKLVVKLVCKKRIWQFTKVHFEKRANTVDVLQISFISQIWHAVFIKSMSKKNTSNIAIKETMALLVLFQEKQYPSCINIHF